jgi:general secretion pathway protein A
MYLQHFGLQNYPFSLSPDPRFLYLTAAHREALAGLLFAVTYRKGFLVLTGDAGTGKTTLLRTVLARTPPATTTFSFVVHTTLTAAEFLESTLLDFGITDIPDSRAQRLRVFRDFLLRSAEEGKAPVLVVDEAQKLSPDLLEEIRLLTNMETAEQKLLQVILAGQDDLLPVLAREGMRQLSQRIAVRVQVRPLSDKDVVQYMRTRWSRAGGADALPFDADAVLAIARYSNGVPRLINAVADAALVKACSTNRWAIQSGDIQAVAQRLGVPEASPRTDPLAGHPQEENVEPTPVLVRHVPEKKQWSQSPALKRWAARFRASRA